MTKEQYMVSELRVKNCFAFNQEITFSMDANIENIKLYASVHRKDDFNVVKTSVLYGENNVGKSCLLKCFRALKNILLNAPPLLSANIFSKSSICSLGITLFCSTKKYSYDIQYDADKKEYIYEKFCEITCDESGNKREDVWLLRDRSNKQYYSKDENLLKDIEYVSPNCILIHILDTSYFPYIDKMKNILKGFASSLCIINMNNIPLDNTIKYLKSQNKEKIVSFIKACDLNIDDISYANMEDIKVPDSFKAQDIEEKVLQSEEKLMDEIRLVSKYNNEEVSSMLFDSTGTKKIIALASYVIQTIEEGNILLIDELDSSINSSLLCTFISMFNNALNTKAQMIFTVSDINKIDCKRLFRKDQICFIYKKGNDVFISSLEGKKYNECGIYPPIGMQRIDKLTQKLIKFLINLVEDKSSYEEEIPPYLKESIINMNTHWEILERGEKDYRWDAAWDNLYSDINCAEVENQISMDHAWYLREKYLRLMKED